MSIIFISGAMTGREDLNRKQFNKIEMQLRKNGHIVLNPAVLPDGMEYDAYIRICNSMINEADALYMMKGWQDSNGAKMEYMYANEKGKAILFEEPFNEKMLWV